MIGGENFSPPPISQNSILGKKRGGALQIGQKINQLGIGSNFQGNPRPTKDCDWKLKCLPPISQNLKKGGSSQNQAKNQQTDLHMIKSS